MKRQAASYQELKHRLDRVVAWILLVPLAPVMVLLGLAIRLESRGPALYRQQRVGQHGELFTILKFRTMKIGTPVLSTEEMQRQHARPFTRLGPLLRKTNLDELPQLFNILKGEMSFIGPRPALPTQVDVNTLREAHGVHRLRPGITGLAQARGRDDLDTITKVRYDAEYLQRLSLALDLRILLYTVAAVATARGNK